MAKLTDTITVPMARASILWLIGEYSDRVPKIAPDVLRKMAKNFVNEVRITTLPSSLLLSVSVSVYRVGPISQCTGWTVCHQSVYRVGLLRSPVF